MYARAWDTISNLNPVWICRDRRTHSQSWVDKKLFDDRPVSTKYCSADFLDQWKERKKIQNLVLKVCDINMFIIRSHLERQLFALAGIFKSSQHFFLLSLPRDQNLGTVVGWTFAVRCPTFAIRCPTFANGRGRLLHKGSNVNIFRSSLLLWPFNTSL